MALPGEDPIPDEVNQEEEEEEEEKPEELLEEAPITRKDINHLKFYFSEIDKLLKPTEANYIKAKQNWLQAQQHMDLQQMYQQKYLYQLAENEVITIHDPLLVLLRKQELDRVAKGIASLPVTQTVQVYTVQTILQHIPAHRLRYVKRLLNLLKDKLYWDNNTGHVTLIYSGETIAGSNILKIMEYFQTSPNIRMYLQVPVGAEKVFDLILIYHLEDLIVKPARDEPHLFEKLQIVKKIRGRARGKQKFRESVEHDLIKHFMQLNQIYKS